MLKTLRIFLILLSILGAVGCTLKEAPKAKRTFIPDLKIQKSTGDDFVPEYKDILYEDITSNACEHLATIERQKSTNRLSDAPHFSIFKYLGISKIQTFDKHTFENVAAEKFWGALDLSESPLTQVILTEKVDTTNKGFMKAVAEKCKNGLLSQWKCNAAKAASGTEWSLTLFKNLALNGELSSAFPGIFGEKIDVVKSLYFGLAQKLGYQTFAQDLNQILTSTTNLMPNEMKGLSSDVETALMGSLSSLRKKYVNESLATQEKMCSFVLLHRIFAQMLTIKGHYQPEMTFREKNDLPAIEKLSRKRPHFEKAEKAGIFYDMSASQNIVLSSEDIQNYNPKIRFLPIVGGLDSSLSVLAAMSSVYVATSPTYWISKEHSIIGDIEDSKTGAILPSDIHKLALGLSTLIIKNLVFQNLIKVNEQGLPVTGDEKPAGVVLVDLTSKGKIIRLTSITQLLKIAIRLDQNLSRFKTKTPNEWEAINPFYTAELLKSLTDELKPKLKQLYLPLFLLGKKMADSCVSELLWDENTGRTEPLSECLGQDLAGFKSVVASLARATRSAGLYKQSK